MSRRAAIECTVGPVRMHGTFHQAERAHDGGDSRVAVLVLNPGHVARAGAGDLLALASDALAEAGHPVYRFDFPGLGDSRGELPRWEPELFRFVQEGGNVDMTLRLLEEVEARSGAKGVVLLGLCGGAITSIFAADRAPAQVDGVIMLDPDFSLLTSSDAEREEEGAAGSGVASRLRKLGKKLTRRQTWIRVFTGENRLRPVLRPILWLLLPIGRRLMGPDLPSDANRPLIAACRRVVDRGTRVFVVIAADKLRDLYLRQVEAVAFGSGDEKSVQRLLVHNTNHVFTAGNAKSKVISEICAWVERHWGEAEEGTSLARRSTA